MLAALVMREACSKQNKQKYDDLVMIINFDKKSNWDAKYIPNFRVMCLIGSRQLEVSDPTDTIRKINGCDVCKILLSNHIVSSIPYEQVFGRRGK